MATTWYRYPPISGTVTASSPATGTNGAAGPASSEQIGGQDGQGFLQPYEVETVQGNRSLPTLARLFALLVATDAAEAASSTTVINATAHAALVGDVIRFTSGTALGAERIVRAVAANSITVSRALPAAPAAADVFQVLRHATPQVNAAGALPVAVAPDTGKAFADSVYRSYTGGGAVTTGAWVQLIAATAAAITALFVDDTGGQVMEIGVGVAASETRVHLIPRGGLSSLSPLAIPAGSRVSIRAVSATANSGELVITAFT